MFSSNFNLTYFQVSAAVGVLSDSSSESGSDSSSDSSESDSDSDLDNTHIPSTSSERNTGNSVITNKEMVPMSNSNSAHLSMPSHLLSEDLRLSDSGSESD